MEKRCRLCMKHGNDLENVIDYDADNNTSIIQQISLFFAVEITLTDHLPKDVCKSCLKFVQYVNSRRKTFLDNQDKLKDELYSALKKNCSVKPVRHQESGYKLSDLKIPSFLRNEDIFPTVEIVNLEESEVAKEYKQVSEFTFRKTRGTIRPASTYLASNAKRKQPENSARPKQFSNRNSTVTRQQRREPELVICDYEKVKAEDMMIKEEPPVVPMEDWTGGYEEMPVTSFLGGCEPEDQYQNEVAEKVFICSLCNAIFDDDTSLSLHSKMHNIKTEEFDPVEF